MGRAHILWLALVLSCFSLFSSAYASTTGDLEKARRLVEEDLRYKEAVDVLERVIASGSLSPDQRIDAHRLLAIASVARGAIARAEAAFRVVLELEPEFELDADVSPKIREVLTRVQAAVARAPRFIDVAALPGARRVDFSARVRDPDARLAAIELYTRTAEGAAFKRLEMTQSGDRVEASIGTARTSADEDWVRVDYFLIGRDEGGAAIARFGDEAQPSSVVVGRSRENKSSAPIGAVVVVPDETPGWYERWWVWAIVVGVVGASTATAIVLSRNSDDPPDNVLDPIRL